MARCGAKECHERNVEKYRERNTRESSRENAERETLRSLRNAMNKQSKIAVVGKSEKETVQSAAQRADVRYRRRRCGCSGRSTAPRRRTARTCEWRHAGAGAGCWRGQPYRKTCSGARSRRLLNAMNALSIPSLFAVMSSPSSLLVGGVAVLRGARVSVRHEIGVGVGVGKRLPLRFGCSECVLLQSMPSATGDASCVGVK